MRNKGGTTLAFFCRVGAINRQSICIQFEVNLTKNIQPIVFWPPGQKD